jgi:ABC-type nickel/cobalt efflux system permease component RcnA
MIHRVEITMKKLQSLSVVCGVMLMLAGGTALAQDYDHGHDRGHDRQHQDDGDRGRGHDDHGHGYDDRDHDHDHDHDHGHHDHDDPALGTRRLLGLGISGGIIPCPTALVVLLAAISLHRIGYGLVLIVAFSLGLAATMTGLGLAAVAARGAFARVDMGGRAIRVLPAVSAVVVLALGLAMTARALPHVT